MPSPQILFPNYNLVVVAVAAAVAAAVDVVAVVPEGCFSSYS